MILLLAGSAMAPSLGLAVTFTVNSTLDQPDDLTMPGTCHTAAGTCTLRAATMQANRTTGLGATIVLPAGTYTITIPGISGSDESTGDLNLTTPLSGAPTITIQGAGADKTVIDGNQLARVFTIGANRVASISGVTVTNGYDAVSAGGGISNFGTLQLSDCVITHNTNLALPARGGGIYNALAASLNLLRVTIRDNAAVQGAGVYSKGSLVATASTFTQNPGDTGTGLYADFNTVSTLQNSTFHLNHAPAAGGAIVALGQMTLTDMTFDANSAKIGGAIYVGTSGALVEIHSSLFTGNSATDGGGGLYTDIGGIAHVYDTTLRANNSFIGGGAYNDAGFLDFNRSTLSGADLGGYAGGIYSKGNSATLFVVESTISHNAVTVNGGGIMNELGSLAHLISSSIVFNAADEDGDFAGAGAGVFNGAGSVMVVENSLVLGNTVSGAPVYDDCYGTIGTNGTNLFSGLPNCTVNGSWAYINSTATVDPTLQKNGGPTETHALLPGSSAIDAIPGAALYPCTGPTDQRGFPRVAGAACDVGAYEYFPPSLDVDGNTAYSPLFDGLLVLRYLFGMRGDSLVAGAIGSNATRNTADKVTAWLDSIHMALDVDGNGQRDALTDGVMIVRYLFGLRGAAITADALGANPTRSEPQIEAHIQSLLP